MKMIFALCLFSGSFILLETLNLFSQYAHVNGFFKCLKENQALILKFVVGFEATNGNEMPVSWPLDHVQQIRGLEAPWTRQTKLERWK